MRSLDSEIGTLTCRFRQEKDAPFGAAGFKAAVAAALSPGNTLVAPPSGRAGRGSGPGFSPNTRPPNVS